MEWVVADAATVEVKRTVDVNPWEASETPLRLMWKGGLQWESEGGSRSVEPV